MVELVDASKSFGSQVLFEHANLRVAPRDRVGLVGPNGTGKTTLFRILLGEMSPDSGRVETARGVRIGHLPQEIYPSTARDCTLIDFCCREARGIGALLDRQAECVRELETDGGDPARHEAAVRRLAGIEDELHARDAASIRTEAESVLLGIGFPREDLDRPLRVLSGGLLMRAELARLLLDRPDLLLLDEPTNHLDLEGIVWFESYLDQFPGAIVMVAHDRQFLNRTVSRIVEVSRRGAVDYGGNPNLTVYDRYVEERAKALELAWKRYEEQVAFIEDQERFIQANKVRKDRAGVVQSRIRMLDKLERLEPPGSVRTVRFQFPQPARSPDLVLSLEGVTRRYGARTVFRGLDLRLLRGEKVALVGVNGAGKSTMLRLIAGITQPDEGERRLADRVEVGWFAQDQFEILKPDRTAEQSVLEVADYDTAPHVRGMLGAFLFRDDDVDKRVAALSGGEKARLMLARMLLRPCGLLVLDEPTNHLDIASREVLEKALRDHAGTIVFTTHDRRFMDNVATAVVELRDGRVVRYEGNYSYYASKVAEAAVPAAGDERPTDAGASRLTPSSRQVEKAVRREEAERRNRMYRILKPLRDRVGACESQIEGLEVELRAVEAELTSRDLYKDIDRARATGQRAKDLRSRLDALYDEWTAAAGELEQAEAAGDPG
ncbi:MAG: ABC-F family ATP-binding cassette domain-containing protein [Deltaproteobacteria bacterium]|nr:ABC-F family ATP-binding cassette domain-containing protein [Deltaproteobacteria bacterium]